MIGFYLPADLDALIKSGKAKDMIVVVANGISKMGGSFYVNSPVTGNWDDFITQDVVNYVDSHLSHVGAGRITRHHRAFDGRVWSVESRHAPT